jgi:pSer/pThr/pTyr-binding forkhead associated (FHA) protein
MALLEMGGRTFPISVGNVVLGRDPGSAIVLTGQGVLPRHAILQGLPDGQVVIRKAVPEAEVTINGVRLGAEPTPLLHGDKVAVAEHELTFVDERRSGSTQYLEAFKPQSAGDPASPPEGPETAATGGRVVCLTDGREYQITGTSLVFGRDATNDVVVPGRDVSRRHAEILQTPDGYLLVDSSTNGTFVNEQRVEGQRRLARADVLRIGDEQFRFYADRGAAPAPPAVSPPPGAEERLKDTVHGVMGGSLGSLFVRAGELKGQRVALRTPVVNIGRADYNDVVFPDASISTAHAKLQRREGVWVLVDLESTNGSYIDGERVSGEAALVPGASVRLGDVMLIFEPGDEAPAVAKGGGTQLLKGLAVPPSASPRPPPAAVTPPSPPASPSPPRAPAPPAAKPARPRPGAKPAAGPPEKQGKGCGSSAAVVLALASALVYWVLA